jgi:hypothetical protein
LIVRAPRDLEHRFHGKPIGHSTEVDHPRMGEREQLTGLDRRPTRAFRKEGRDAGRKIVHAEIERVFADANAVVTQSQSVIAHELEHQFKVNRSLDNRTGGHDDRTMWCSGLNACGAPGAIADGGIRCVMQPSVPANVSVNHFCLEDLMLGDPDALDGTDGRKLYSIRGIEDPL